MLVLNRLITRAKKERTVWWWDDMGAFRHRHRRVAKGRNMKLRKRCLVATAICAGILLACQDSPTPARVMPGGVIDDQQASIVYWSATGELAADVPTGRKFTSINVESPSGIFTGDPARNLGGSFDNHSDWNIFKATFGTSFGSISFGNVARPQLDQQFLLDELTVVGSFAEGGNLGPVDLVYFGSARNFNASFCADGDANSLDIDFGDVAWHDRLVPIGFGLSSLIGLDGVASIASLDLLDIQTVLASEALSTDLIPFTDLEPGQTRGFSAFLDTSKKGRFRSDLLLRLANSADPFERELLEVHLTGKVVDPPVGAVVGVTASDGSLPTLEYDPLSGELSLRTDDPLTAIHIQSASGIFTGPTPDGLLEGSFDVHDANGIFKATFGDSFGAIQFGPIVQPGLSFDFLLNDLTVIGSLQRGGGLNNVFLITPLPEPPVVVLLVVGTLCMTWLCPAWRRCRHAGLPDARR